MPSSHGRSLPLSLPRRFATDLLHFARQAPAVTVERRLRLAPVIAVRQVVEPALDWAVLFLKAYAIVAARQPVLRRAYLDFPRPRLYEHPVSIASVAVERVCGDEEMVFPLRIPMPETRTLLELDAALQRGREASLETVSNFRRLLRLSRLPRPLRRLIWYLAVKVSGARRATFLGTFALSPSGEAALATPLSTGLNWSAVEPDGTLSLRLTFDARVLDAPTAGKMLAETEEVLLGEVLNELRYLEALRAA